MSNNKNQGLALDITEGTFAIVAVFRHDGKVHNSFIAGHLADLNEMPVEIASHDLIESLRKKAIDTGAITIN